MKQYTLNFAESKKLYEANKKDYKLKDCYRNIFRAVNNKPGKVRAGQWKIAYGYMSCLENVFVRHCFIIDENGEVLDPTLFTKMISDEKEKIYYAMKIFSNIDDYLSAVEREEFRPALIMTLLPYEQEAHKWASKNGFVFCG